MQRAIREQLERTRDEEMEMVIAKLDAEYAGNVANQNEFYLLQIQICLS